MSRNNPLQQNLEFSTSFLIGERRIGLNYATYFIADLAANHDGDFDRAKKLIDLAKESGADAAKFQHFDASTIVSDYGYKNIGEQQGHQATWSKSVYEVYEDASIDVDWTPKLKEYCDKVGIEFMTSPYSPELIDYINPFVKAMKIGSGEITSFEAIKDMSSKGKPVLIAAGASDLAEVVKAIAVVAAETRDVCLMQCNTNYTASIENFYHINLRALESFKLLFPGIVLGLSDHTPGHSTVLGAVALGAKVIEKHFTDDNNRVGPDHKFAMNPKSWKEMVDRTRELEAALGDGFKRVQDNESETVVLQRRALRVRLGLNLTEGTIIQKEHLIPLRPCPKDAINPSYLDKVIGQELCVNKIPGDCLRWEDFNWKK